MDQNPNYNDIPVIILRLSPRCSIQSLSNMLEALRSMSGVSEVAFDIKSMKLRIRSMIDPFELVREIEQPDANLKIILYIREPMADGGDNDPNNPNGWRNNEQFEEDDGDYKGKRNNGQGNNGWRNNHEEERHVRFEDDYKAQRNRRPECYEDVKDREHVCRNYREDGDEAPPPRTFSDGMSSHLRSRSFRFDERNFRANFRSHSSRFGARNY